MAKKVYESDLDVEFGGVSYGHDTARLGLKIDRGKLDLSDADGMFSGMRIECEVSLLNRSDRGQKRLRGMEDNTPATIQTVADVKRFGVSATTITASLTFSKSSIDVGALPEFANESGTLRLTVMGAIPEDEGGEGDRDDDGDGEDREPATVSMHRIKGGRMVTRRTAAKAAVTKGDKNAESDLAILKNYGITPKKIDIIRAACGGNTIGHFETWMTSNEWWHRDLKGFGEDWITKLQDAHLKYRRDFPVLTEEDEPEGDEGTVLDPAVAGAE